MSLLATLAKKALNDSYLNELVYKLEDIYSQNYFHAWLSDVPLSNKELLDLLRYADILSHGETPTARNLSFKILSLLHQSYSTNNDYLFHANGILTRLGNFPSLSLVTDNEEKYETIDTMVDKVVKYDVQKTPDGNGVFTDSQYEVFNSLINSNHFSFSGPTSFGKSFIMDAYIKYLITQRPGLDNIAVLVPTRALINQVSARLRKEIDSKQYAVLTHPTVPRLFDGVDRKYIFIFTPERLVAYYGNQDNPSIQYMFVDEAQKIVQENDSRAPLYYHAISMADKKSVKLYFASPNIPNAEVFLKIFDKSTDESLAISDMPVAQNRYFVDLVEGKQWTFHDLITEPNETNYSNAANFNELLSRLGRDDKSIIYCNSVKDTINYALDFAEALPVINDPEVNELIQYIKKTVHKEYFLIDCLKKGVTFHFGRLPQRIRERVEHLYVSGKINQIFCTSTMLEGVNLPAKNIFILNNKIGLSLFTKIDFWNLAGRAGRLNKELSGNIVCVRCEENRWTVDKAMAVMADKGRDKLKPVILTGGRNFYKNVTNSLRGTEFTRKITSKDEQEFLNGFANILYSHETSHTDSLLMNNYLKNTVDGKQVLAKISKTNQVPASILEQSIAIKPTYQNKLLLKLRDSQSKDFYPRGMKYDECLAILEHLYKIYNWSEEESTGSRPMVKTKERLRYLASLMSSWINSTPLNLIIRNIITYYDNEGKIWMDNSREYEVFNKTDRMHINEVINNLIYDIDNFLRFRVKNYLTNYELIVRYAKDVQIDSWANYIEYGTSKPEIIALQELGLSRHLAMFVAQNYNKKFIIEDNEVIEFNVEAMIKNSNTEEYADEINELKEVFNL